MAEENAELFQVSVCQLGQDLGVNRIPAERLLVPLQPDAP
jgi:hypothetical protein